MDGQRFDDLARRIATSVTRRGALGLVAGAAAGLVGMSSRSVGAGSCLDGGKECSGRRGEECCSGACCEKVCCDDGYACTGKGCCPAIQSCGELCCPPENVGCTSLVLFDGTVTIGCLCKEGYYYEDEKCIPCTTSGEKCGDDVECCSGSCCNGACCPDGFVCDGRSCVCPDGKEECKETCCPPDRHCVDGACLCPAELKDCGEECCSPGYGCSGAGYCSCPIGQKDCGAECCPGEHSCSPDGTCGCPNGYLDCGDECVPKEVQGFEGYWPGCCSQRDCPAGWTCDTGKHICLECLSDGDCPGSQQCCEGNCWDVPAGCYCSGGSIQCPVDE
jgi:hypothetical protein